MNYQYGNLLLKERDLLIIFDAIQDDKYDIINENYPELATKYQSLKIIIDTYIDVRREPGASTSIIDLSFLMNILDAVKCFDKKLTVADIDTITLLLNLSYHSYRYDFSFRKFKALLILVYSDKAVKELDPDTLRFLDQGIDCFLFKFKDFSINDLELPDKVREIFNICKIVEDDFAQRDFLNHGLINILTIYGCLNNNFTYLYNYLSNKSNYQDFLLFNELVKDDFVEDYNLIPSLYKDIETIFKVEKDSSKLID